MKNLAEGRLELVGKIAPQVRHLSPSYLFFVDVIIDNMSKWRESAKRAGVPIGIAYSIKTNPLPFVVETIASEGGWADVISGDEARIALRSNCDKIIFNSVYKAHDEIELLAEMGGVIVIDGYQQLADVLKYARAVDKRVEVGVRISSSSIMNNHMARFGFSEESSSLLKVVNDIESVPNVELTLLHMHIGTNVRDPQQHVEVFRRLFHVWNYLRTNGLGLGIHYIDIGGGYPSGLTIDSLVAMFSQISGVCDLNKLPVSLVVEPGRSIMEEAGVLLCHVIDVRVASNEDVVVVLDAGTNCVMGVSYNVNHEVAFLPKRMPTGRERKINIFGPLGHSEDLIVAIASDCLPVVGDLCAIGDVGGYDYSTAYSFGRPLPSALLVRGKEIIDAVLPSS